MVFIAIAIAKKSRSKLDYFMYSIQKRRKPGTPLSMARLVWGQADRISDSIERLLANGNWGAVCHSAYFASGAGKGVAGGAHATAAVAERREAVDDDVGPATPQPAQPTPEYIFPSKNISH